MRADWRKAHLGRFVSLDLVGFCVQLGGHLGEGLARVIVPGDTREFTALLGTHTETL